MNNLAENFRDGGWIRFLFIFILVSVLWYFMRRKVDKMEKETFDGDERRYRADENGVSPFDRPPVGYGTGKETHKERIRKKK